MCDDDVWCTDEPILLAKLKAMSKMLAKM